MAAGEFVDHSLLTTSYQILPLALLHVGSERWNSRHTLTWPPWRDTRHINRPLFQGSKHGRLLEAVHVGERNKTMLGADGFKPALLTRAEHAYRQSVEIAKDPEQVNPLHEGRVYIARAKRGKHAQHSGEECLHQHELFTCVVEL